MNDAVDDIDALDAELFGNTASKFASISSSSRKKVSFAGENKKDLQELEINYDDPLEGLLSCSADDDFSQSKKVYQFSSKGVHQKNQKISTKFEDVDLFGDEGIEAILETPDKNKVSSKSTSKKLEATKVLDDLLLNKNYRSSLNSERSAKNLLFGKDRNFIQKYSTKEDIDENILSLEEAEKIVNNSSIQKDFPEKDYRATANDEFSNLDMNEKSPINEQKVWNGSKTSHEPKSSTSTKKTSQINTSLNNRLKSNFVKESTIDESYNLVSSKKKNSSNFETDVLNASSTEIPLSFLVKKTSSSSKQTKMDSSTRKNYDPIHCQPPVNLENDSKVYIKNSKNISNSTSMPNGKIEALEMQVSKLQSQLAQVENGYKSDRDITKQSYDSRIELLQKTLSNLKTQNEREVSFIRENYSIRLENIRSQTKEYLKEINEKELLEVNEISKMRKLHVEAMNDLRKDNEEKEKILKEVHKKEIESISAYGTQSRSIDEMMNKVNETMKKVNDFTEKYESTFIELGRKFEISTKLLSESINSFTEKVKILEKTSQDTNNNLQNSTSRYDKRLIELDLKFDEQLSIMRKEQYLLSSAKSSFDEERKFFRYQAELNKEQMQKIQDIFLEEQQNLKRQVQNEREKLYHKEENVKEDFIKKSREFSTQFERLNAREEELSRQGDILLEERAEVKRRCEKLDDLEKENASKQEKTEIKLIESKRRLMEVEKKENQLKLLNDELERKKQFESKRVLEGEVALKEAEAIKNEQKHRIQQLNSVKNEITEQRKRLAQERKVIADEYNNNVSRQLNWHFSGSPREDKKELDNEACSLLWMHNVQNDYSFLKNEECYLETLKNSSYSEKFNL